LPAAQAWEFLQGNIFCKNSKKLSLKGENCDKIDL